MKRLFLVLALLMVAVSAWGQVSAPGGAKSSEAQKVSPLAEYVGDWIATLDGKAWLLLQLELHDGQLTGWLTHSRDLEMNDEGGLRSVSDDKVKGAIADVTVDPDGLLLSVKYAEAKEADQYVMKVTEPGKTAELKVAAAEMPAGMPKPKPWPLTKFPEGVEVQAH